MNQRNWIALVALSALSVLGCDEKKEPPTEAKAIATAAATATPAPTPAAAEPSANAAQAEAKAEAAKEQAQVDENPLTACCRSLGQKGFMERSPEYMGASQACGEALQAKKDLASVLPDIKKALKGKPLPDTCAK